MNCEYLSFQEMIISHSPSKSKLFIHKIDAPRRVPHRAGRLVNNRIIAALILSAFAFLVAVEKVEGAPYSDSFYGFSESIIEI